MRMLPLCMPVQGLLRRSVPAHYQAFGRMSSRCSLLPVHTGLTHRIQSQRCMQGRMHTVPWLQPYRDVQDHME